MKNKKKVLVFIPEFPVLTQTFIERELAKLVERGNVDIVVFSLRKGGGKFSDILKDKVFYQRLSFLDIPGIFVYIFSHFSLIYKVFSSIEKPVEVSIGKKIESMYMLFKSVGYARKFSRFDPDLILAHFLSKSSTIAMYAAQIMKKPYAISAHAKDITVTPDSVKEKVKTAKFITICNKNAYEKVLDQAGNLDKSNIYLSYHGVDVQKIYQSVSNKDFRSEKPLILSVGSRLVEKKGLEYLIKAAEILKIRGLEFTIYIVGFGPLYESLLSQIKDLGLEDCVIILGENKGLSNEETLMYFKSASVLSFPSIEAVDGDVDGIANVLLEAGIFKLPVVSTNAGSTGEIIIDNETGLVVPQKDFVLLAEKIEVLLKDKELAQKLGQGLYNRVVENFDLDKSILNLESLLMKDY